MGKYVEPKGYFSPSMKKILEEGEKKEKAKTTKKPTEKKSTTKKK